MEEGVRNVSRNRCRYRLYSSRQEHGGTGICGALPSESLLDPDGQHGFQNIQATEPGTDRGRGLPFRSGVGLPCTGIPVLRRWPYPGGTICRWLRSGSTAHGSVPLPDRDPQVRFHRYAVRTHGNHPESLMPRPMEARILSFAGGERLPDGNEHPYVTSQAMSQYHLCQHMQHAAVLFRRRGRAESPLRNGSAPERAVPHPLSAAYGRPPLPYGPVRLPEDAGHFTDPVPGGSSSGPGPPEYPVQGELRISAWEFPNSPAYMVFMAELSGGFGRSIWWGRSEQYKVVIQGGPSPGCSSWYLSGRVLSAVSNGGRTFRVGGLLPHRLPGMRSGSASDMVGQVAEQERDRQNEMACAGPPHRGTGSIPILHGSSRTFLLRNPVGTLP